MKNKTKIKTELPLKMFFFETLFTLRFYFRRSNRQKWQNKKFVKRNPFERVGRRVVADASNRVPRYSRVARELMTNTGVVAGAAGRSGWWWTRSHRYPAAGGRRDGWVATGVRGGDSVTTYVEPPTNNPCSPSQKKTEGANNNNQSNNDTVFQGFLTLRGNRHVVCALR